VAEKADVLRRFIYPLRTKPVKICPRGNDRFWREADIRQATRLSEVRAGCFNSR
jgi:hypothetical protein